VYFAEHSGFTRSDGAVEDKDIAGREQSRQIVEGFLLRRAEVEVHRFPPKM